VLAQGADLREQVRATGHRAAPGEVDFDILKIGEHFRQQRTIPGGKIVRRIFKVARGAAEQQAVFPRNSVVVDDRANIAEGAAQRADAFDQLIGKGSVET
jgi:7,8-dihydro-6-hydroxymethylpterin-pyrophosphokinase